MIDKIQPKGLLVATLYRDGKIVYQYETHNLILNSGLSQIAGLVAGIQTAYYNTMVIGTAIPTLSATDTSLAGSVMATTTTNTLITTTVPNDTAKFVGTFNFTGSYTLYGAMLQLAGGTPLAEGSLGSITAVNGDLLVLSWAIQF
ncbi:MAG: hypothetical protein QXF41_03335 [Candidatus Micrarchaeaceae archaeon]